MTTDLAVHTPLDNLATLDNAMEVCQALAQSDLVPASLRNKPHNILLVYLNGRELGLTVAQSLRTIYSPGPGQIGMRVPLMLAKLREAGHDYAWEFTGEGEQYACTFRISRGDSPNKYEASFSVADALSAQLVKRAQNGDIVAYSRDSRPLPWMTYRDDMLFARAASRAVTRAAPEVLLGFEVIDGAVQQEEETTLQPGAGPPATPAAEGATRDVVPGELAALDAQGRDAAPGQGPGEKEVIPGAAGSPGPTGREHVTSPPAGQAWANTAQLNAVSRRFKELGLPPRSHLDQVLRACTIFCRRRITEAPDMYSTEATELATALARIQRSAPADANHMALAGELDAAVETWREEWAAFDPEGYSAVMGAERGAAQRDETPD